MMSTHQTNKTQLIFIMLSMLLGIVLLIIDSILAYGWITAAWWGYGLSALYVGYAVFKKDGLLLKFIVFALAAGFTELLPDNWLVQFTKTLIYPKDEPMLLSSPAYMPFSWLVVLVQLGYLGWWASHRIGLVKASVGLMIAGALLVPLYEHWAINAGWWYYENTRMMGTVPYYVILAEGLLMSCVPFILQKVEQSKGYQIILWGIAEGLVMWLACIIAWFTLG